jgi:hypothetical protein
MIWTTFLYIIPAYAFVVDFGILIAIVASHSSRRQIILLIACLLVAPSSFFVGRSIGIWIITTHHLELLKIARRTMEPPPTNHRTAERHEGLVDVVAFVKARP